MAEIKFNICNNSLSNAVDEVIEAVKWGIEQLGYPCTVAQANVEFDAINILFAGMTQDLGIIKQLAPNTIVFNLEQLGDHKSMINSATYFATMRNLPTWEYARTNLERLPKFGVSELHHVPLGFLPIFERIIPSEKDIDVFFYGSKNARRRAIIDSIKAKGLKVVENDGPLSPKERDALIARSKVVLNICYFDNTHIFEEVRASYLLNNKVCVVSEIRPDTIIEDDMRLSCAFAPKEKLPDLCLEICNNEQMRNEIAQKGYDIFKKREWLKPLKSAIDHYIANHLTNPFASKPDVELPNKINFGSGKEWKYDYLNIDSISTRGADLVLDQNCSFDFDTEYYSWRFGKCKLPVGYFNYIVSPHFFEQISNLSQYMTTCIGLLNEGGILEIEANHDLADNASQDPRNVRAFNEKSWSIYGPSECWKLGWKDACLELISQVIVLTSLGRQMQNDKISLEVILRTPRAVAGMAVKLRKRQLTREEKAKHQEHSGFITVE